MGRLSRPPLGRAQAGLDLYEDERASAREALELAPGLAPACMQIGSSCLFNKPR